LCIRVLSMTRHDVTPTAASDQKGTKKSREKHTLLSRKLLRRPLFGLFVSFHLYVCCESLGGTAFSKNAIESPKKFESRLGPNWPAGSPNTHFSLLLLLAGKIKTTTEINFLKGGGGVFPDYQGPI
jgi:hypothetical protein